ncbi:hypothetical protein CA85_21420 [Allorhodopirellula solitaria]|uniref:Uncharacterized protein n=1 Tax=Allorhodopirellula solitaria TaxID=2527987 RepID=A0A5C5Y125_9BACT|nr:hypothetical protein CA85_21420 [Allorhodopirellula solitaria]
MTPPARDVSASGLKSRNNSDSDEIGADTDFFRLIRRKRAPEVFKAWLPYRRIYLWDVIINVRLALPGETEPSSAEVLAWQGISRSPAFPCKSGTPMVLSVPGERLFVRDAFWNDHWIREPCLKKPSAVLCACFRRMNPFLAAHPYPHRRGRGDEPFRLVLPTADRRVVRRRRPSG